MDVEGEESRRREADINDDNPPKRLKSDAPGSRLKHTPPPNFAKAGKSILRRGPLKRKRSISFFEHVKLIHVEKFPKSAMQPGLTDDDALYNGRTRQVELDAEGREIKDSKHTLDSDEEEEPDHTVLNTRDVDGQEERTIAYDGDTKITPFNMDEDLEEGDFDTAGNFVRDKKKADELKDAWYDSVDWKKIEQKDAVKKEEATSSGNKDKSTGSGNDEYDVDMDVDDDSDNESLDEEGMHNDYVALAKLLQAGETPAGAMKRIVRNRPSEKDMRQQRFAAKKEGKKFVDIAGAHVEAINEYASRIQRNGYYNILNTPKEDIQKLIEEYEARKEANRSVDDASAKLGEEKEEESDSEETYWEVQKPGAPEGVYDTHSTKKMVAMLESGEIANDTLCRRVGTECFYEAGRSSFDLFLDL
uniref:GYF domain-containing protein n=1 Tax=Panagrellus redivivus TaxID=6233 RepID=A0A7E4V246_PANRE